MTEPEFDLRDLHPKASRRSSRNARRWRSGCVGNCDMPVSLCTGPTSAAVRAGIPPSISSREASTHGPGDGLSTVIHLQSRDRRLTPHRAAPPARGRVPGPDPPCPARRRRRSAAERRRAAVPKRITATPSGEWNSTWVRAQPYGRIRTSPSPAGVPSPSSSSARPNIHVTPSPSAETCAGKSMCTAKGSAEL